MVFGSTNITTNASGVAQIRFDNPTDRTPDMALVGYNPAVADLPGRIYDPIVYQWDSGYINVRIRRLDNNQWAGSNQTITVSYLCLWGK